MTTIRKTFSGFEPENLEFTGFALVKGSGEESPDFMQATFKVHTLGDVPNTEHVITGKLRTAYNPSATLTQMETDARRDIVRVLRAIADDIERTA